MTSIKTHILQHVPFEGPAMIATWAETKGHFITYTRFWENPALPGMEAFDWLVIMGGPMNVDEYDQYPWLESEIRFIKEAIASGKTVIGVCLGAQMIAKALGSRVVSGGKKEIGWFPVSFSTEGVKESGFSILPEKTMVFHWHGDTFDIPEGSIHLASSEAFPNQAFLFNQKVLGLQFHLEMDREALESIIRNAGDELISSEFVQDEYEILNNLQYLADGNLLLYRVLDCL